MRDDEIHDAWAHAHDGTRPKEYVGIIWIHDAPGVRIRVTAHDAKEAGAMVVREYGEGHVYTIWNEDDRNRPR